MRSKEDLPSCAALTSSPLFHGWAEADAEAERAASTRMSSIPVVGFPCFSPPQARLTQARWVTVRGFKWPHVREQQGTFICLSLPLSLFHTPSALGDLASKDNLGN